MSKDKKPMFGSLFGKESSTEDKSDSKLDVHKLLLSLADGMQGLDVRIDAEITKLKKMLQIGTSANELHSQVLAICQCIVNYKDLSNQEENITLDKVSAIEFIDTLLEEDLDNDVKTKLKNYQRSLSQQTTSRQALMDIIELVEPDEDISDEEITHSNLDPEEIRKIASPIVKLLNTIELEQGQIRRTSELLELAQSMSTNNDLCKLLEGVSELIIRSIYSANDTFEHFLSNLKERLERVDGFIGQNDKTHQAISVCSKTLTENVNKHVDDLQLVMTDTKTLEELETHVKRSLENISDGLEGFNQERRKLEAEAQARIEELQQQLDAAKNETENLRDNLKQQRKRASTDALTKLPNRHAYNERLHLEYNRWRRYKKPLCLVIGDLDHFKEVNDNHGHTVGDHVLATTAHILASNLRETDFVGRYGGEEFVLLLPETNVKDAIRAMNKIRRQVQEQSYQAEEKSFNVTMSFGVATFENNDDFNLVFNRADTALYRAKTRGRNQVCAELKKSA